ncbi:MAG: DNA primase [Patescibacteria group bacterium]
MSNSVEQIKQKLSIVDLVGGYVKLEKAGVNWKGRCPFHNEKTPSFFVSPGRETFHCFGCAKGGDIFTFTQEIEGLDFMGALKMLADRTGVTLERERKEERTEKEKLLAIMTDASLMFQATLGKNMSVLEYVHDRGLTDETIRHFEVGFAPDGWRVLHEFLLSRKHDEALIEKTGMIIRSPKGPFYDRFRGRVMFPIKDTVGNTIGFSGRVLGDELPKYMNSPETTLYQKSHVLFGIDKAKQAIRKSDCTILVEGQMDLVLSHQSGVTNAVAVSGTALTEDHLVSLKRLSENLVMAFDADAAGIKAAGRALAMALGLGMNVKVALLPPGMDPADVARANPSEWTRLIKEADHVIDFYLGVYRAQNLSGAELRKRIQEELMPFVGSLASSLDQGHYVKKVAEHLGVSESAVWESVRSVPKISRTRPDAGAPRKELPKEESRVKELLAKLLGALAMVSEKADSLINVAEIRREVDLLLGERAAALVEEVSAKIPEYALQAEVMYGENPKGIRELFPALAEGFLKDEFSVTMKKLRDAEAVGDTEQVKLLLAECQRITSQITQLKKERILRE